MTSSMPRFALAASLIALATPASAQDAAPSTPLDDLAPAEGAPVAAVPAKTGDVVVDRLNALEAEVNALKVRNATLEEKLGATQTRVESVEVRAAKEVQWASGGPAPLFGDVGGDFTFKPRGTIEVEGASYFGRRGGYNYNDGTGFRRARFGFEGTFLHDFGFRFETEFSGSQVQLYDAYVTYNGIKPLTITVGQHKAFFSLDQMTSQTNLTFEERSMFVNGFGGPAAGRRIGVSVAYNTDKVTAAIGVFGENESFTRQATAPGEGYGVHGRVTWEPIQDTGKLIHVGAGGFWRTAQQSGGVNASYRVSDRPDTRIDGGLILDSGIVPNVDNAYEWNAEAAAVRGPFYVQAEYGRLYLDRTGPKIADVDFDGGYAQASWYITGESRAFKGGVPDKLRPLHNFDRGAGGWGAFELAFRYDSASVFDTPVTARFRNKAETYTTALNWYMNPNLRLMFNWIRFEGTNTALNPVGTKTAGDALQTRLHLDF